MSLTAECLAQLGLERAPFGPIPDDAFVYRDALLDGIGDLALRGLTEPGAILVLAGAAGSGRSTQLQHILSLLPDDAELLAFRARTDATYEAVDATLRLQLAQLGSQDQSASLLHLIGERVRAGANLVLAIDDAHLLPTPVLERLFQLRRHLLERLGAAMRHFLIGDPAFAASALPELDADEDGRVLRLHLRAFNPAQTQAYLRHRLRGAGHPHPESLLRRDLVDRLHATSNGLPKYLNALATEWLTELCSQSSLQAFDAVERDSVDDGVRSVGSSEGADPMTSAMAALEALRNASREALGAGAGGWPRGVVDADPNDQRTQGQAAKLEAALEARLKKGAQERAAGQPKQPKKDAKQPQASDAAPAKALWNQPWFVPGIALFTIMALLLPLVWQLPGSDSRDPAHLVGGTGIVERSAQHGERPPVAPGVPALSPAPSPEPVVPPANEDALAAVEENAPEDAGTEPRQAAQSADSSAEPRPEAEPEAETGQATAVVEKATEKPQVENGGPETLAEDPGRGAVKPPRASAAGLDSDWLSKQPRQHFTIQLAAAVSLAAAKDYVRGFDGLDVRFAPTRSNSRNYIVVLVGVYPNRADAERAVATLPSALVDKGYWIRSVDSVRRSLR